MTEELPLMENDLLEDAITRMRALRRPKTFTAKTSWTDTSSTPSQSSCKGGQLYSKVMKKANVAGVVLEDKAYGDYMIAPTVAGGLLLKINKIRN